MCAMISIHHTGTSLRVVCSRLCLAAVVSCGLLIPAGVTDDSRLKTSVCVPSHTSSPVYIQNSGDSGKAPSPVLFTFYCNSIVSASGNAPSFAASAEPLAFRTIYRFAKYSTGTFF